MARLDLSTGEIAIVNETLPRTANPQFNNEDLEVGEGSVWLQRGSQILKIDPGDASHTPVGIGFAGTGNHGIDIGFWSVWLARGELHEVDAATGRGERRIRLPGINPTDIAVGFEGVWVTGIEGILARFDPASGELDPFEIGGTLEYVATGTDAVWVTDGFGGAVLRVDPESGQVVDAVELSGGLDRIAVGEGFVWVLDTTLGLLTPIGEGNGEARDPIQVGSDAEDVAVGLGSVWVVSGGNVLEIDPGTLQLVDTIEIGTVPIADIAVEIEAGALWLTFSSG